MKITKYILCAPCFNTKAFVSVFKNSFKIYLNYLLIAAYIVFGIGYSLAQADTHNLDSQSPSDISTPVDGEPARAVGPIDAIYSIDQTIISSDAFGLAETLAEDFGQDDLNLQYSLHPGQRIKVLELSTNENWHQQWHKVQPPVLQAESYAAVEIWQTQLNFATVEHVLLKIGVQAQSEGKLFIYDSNQEQLSSLLLSQSDGEELVSWYSAPVHSDQVYIEYHSYAQDLSADQLPVFLQSVYEVSSNHGCGAENDCSKNWQLFYPYEKDQEAIANRLCAASLIQVTQNDLQFVTAASCLGLDSQEQKIPADGIFSSAQLFIGASECDNTPAVSLRGVRLVSHDLASGIALLAPLHYSAQLESFNPAGLALSVAAGEQVKVGAAGARGAAIVGDKLHTAVHDGQLIFSSCEPEGSCSALQISGSSVGAASGEGVYLQNDLIGPVIGSSKHSGADDLCVEHDSDEAEHYVVGSLANLLRSQVLVNGDGHSEQLAFDTGNSQISQINNHLNLDSDIPGIIGAENDNFENVAAFAVGNTVILIWERYAGTGRMMADDEGEGGDYTLMNPYNGLPFADPADVAVKIEPETYTLSSADACVSDTCSSVISHAYDGAAKAHLANLITSKAQGAVGAGLEEDSSNYYRATEVDQQLQEDGKSAHSRVFDLVSLHLTLDEASIQNASQIRLTLSAIAKQETYIFPHVESESIVEISAETEAIREIDYASGKHMYDNVIGRGWLESVGSHKGLAAPSISSDNIFNYAISDTSCIQKFGVTYLSCDYYSKEIIDQNITLITMYDDQAINPESSYVYIELSRKEQPLTITQQVSLDSEDLGADALSADFSYFNDNGQKGFFAVFDKVVNLNHDDSSTNTRVGVNNQYRGNYKFVYGNVIQDDNTGSWKINPDSHVTLNQVVTPDARARIPGCSADRLCYSYSGLDNLWYLLQNGKAVVGRPATQEGPSEVDRFGYALVAGIYVSDLTNGAVFSDESVPLYVTLASGVERADLIDAMPIGSVKYRAGKDALVATFSDVPEGIASGIVRYKARVDSATNEELGVSDFAQVDDSSAGWVAVTVGLSAGKSFAAGDNLTVYNDGRYGRAELTLESSHLNVGEVGYTDFFQRERDLQVSWSSTYDENDFDRYLLTYTAFDAADTPLSESAVSVKIDTLYTKDYGIDLALDDGVAYYVVSLALQFDRDGVSGAGEEADSDFVSIPLGLEAMTVSRLDLRSLVVGSLDEYSVALHWSAEASEQYRVQLIHANGDVIYATDASFDNNTRLFSVMLSPAIKVEIAEATHIRVVGANSSQAIRTVPFDYVRPVAIDNQIAALHYISSGDLSFNLQSDLFEPVADAYSVVWTDENNEEQSTIFVATQNVVLANVSQSDNITVDALYAVESSGTDTSYQSYIQRVITASDLIVATAEEEPVAPPSTSGASGGGGCTVSPESTNVDLLWIVGLVSIIMYIYSCIMRRMRLLYNFV